MGAQYAISMGAGFKLAIGMMVITLAYVVLLGRWLTAEEFWPSVLLRGLLLFGLIPLALVTFETLWYWLLLPLAFLPMIRIDTGGRRYSDYLLRHGQATLEAARAAAAAQPDNPVLRISLGRLLLETRQIFPGLATLDQAISVAGAGAKELITKMAEETKAAYLKFCPKCGLPNLRAGLVCGNCFSPLDDSPTLRLLLKCCKPLWRLSRGNRG
jgi:hypothetical protein